MSKIELVPVASLRPALYNPREADGERLELVRLSLQKLGFLLPLVATVDGEILSGHQRHSEAVRMGATHVPVMLVDVPEAQRRGINILFNRATNDITITATEQDMADALSSAGVRTLAETLPDIPVDSPAFFPCMSAQMAEVAPLARQNVFSFVRHAANVGRMLARLHVQLPIVATPDGTVVNGVGRLEAAARKGRKQIAVVTLAEDKAALARAMLNLLSMDFRFTGENADFLRYGSFRRAWLKRSFLGTAFVLPVFSHKRLADVSLADPHFLAKWKAACGENILDFGSGQGDEARMLREAGIRVTEFEPYPAERNIVSRERGRLFAMQFLAAVRRKEAFSAIFVSSVLNSVPFPEDREHVLRIVAALCSPETVVYAAARGKNGSDWQWLTTGEAMSARASRVCGFKLASEDGIVLGDIAANPKAQKFFGKEEFHALFARHFGEVTVGKADSMVTARCRNPLFMLPQQLAESLRFEFNLPYPGNKRMGLAKLALEAFSVRLGLNLGAI